MATKDLDPGNVIKQVYDPATESIQTVITGSSGPIEITATSPIPVDIGGTGTVDVLVSIEIPFSSIPSSASAPFEIIASLPKATRSIKVYDTTGEAMQLRTGAAAGTLLYLTGPGDDAATTVTVASGTRLSIRSNGPAPTAGSYIITVLG
jgi:hypothetical protein